MYRFEDLDTRDKLVLYALRALAQVMAMTDDVPFRPDVSPGLREARRDLRAFALNLLDDLGEGLEPNYAAAIEAGQVAGMRAGLLSNIDQCAELQLCSRAFQSAVRLALAPVPRE